MALDRSTRHNGYAVRAVREIRGISVAQLCAEVVVDGRPLSQPALRNYELEHREPSAATIKLLGLALDIPGAALVRTPIEAVARTRHNGVAVRAIRQARGLSVQELCNAVTSGGRDLSAPALRNIELEHRDCKPDLIERIAKALDVDVRALVRIPLAQWGVKGAAA